LDQRRGKSWVNVKWKQFHPELRPEKHKKPHCDFEKPGKNKQLKPNQKIARVPNPAHQNQTVERNT